MSGSMPSPATTASAPSSRESPAWTALARQHLDALLAVVVGDELRERGGEEAGADPVVGEEHGHVRAARLQRRRDLGADEAAAHDDEPPVVAGEPAKALVVVEGAEVDRIVEAVDLTRLAARRQQDALVAVFVALVVGRGAAVEVERDDPAAGVQLGPELLRPAPDRALVLALPERFRERRPIVGRVRLGADEPDRAVGVVLADPAAGGIAGHASSDDQVAVRAHGFSFLGASYECRMVFGLSVSNLSRTRHDSWLSRHPRVSQLTLQGRLRGR